MLSFRLPFLGRSGCSALRASIVEQVFPVGTLRPEAAVSTVVLGSRLGRVEMSMVDVKPHNTS